MRVGRQIIFLICILLLYSCYTVNVAARRDKDINLTTADTSKLRGSFSALPIDTSWNARQRDGLAYMFFDTLAPTKETTTVMIEPKGEHTLVLHLKKDSVYLRTIKLKGRYDDGYFKLRKRLKAKFVFGPLLWVLYGGQTCIGLTKENNLVVLYSKSAGSTMFLVLPIFVAGAEPSEGQYLRN